MTAAMNGSVNFSIPDGWVPEFAVHGKNCFSVEPAERTLPEADQNRVEAERMYDMLEKLIIPTYYDHPDQWCQIVRRAWKDVLAEFDSGRMAGEYYEVMYK
jgi:starch phosphorylase